MAEPVIVLPHRPPQRPKPETARPVNQLVRVVVRICEAEGCGKSFNLPMALPQKVCTECIDRQQAAQLETFRAEQAERLPVTIDEKLRSCGLRDVEITARLERIPEELKRKLPAKRVTTLMGGAHHSGLAGFGLAGGQGIGKTMAIAAMLRARTEAILNAALSAIAEIPGAGELPWHTPAGCRWINWPDQANLLKALSTQQGGAQEVERFTRAASGTSLLIIDDLGRERLNRNYDEDYAFGVLDRVVDARSRTAAPILWTSNLSRSGLATRYGAALTSRLLGLAPAIELPRMTDRRLA
jgi:DNA replication protein DnaC